jgi:TrmH family RNA methyltransferase
LQTPLHAHSSASAAGLTAAFRAARRDPALAVLEGLHALKHALRFGAHVQQVAIVDPERVLALAHALAPDVQERILAGAQVVSPEVFAGLAPQAPTTGVIAIAQRPPVDLDALLAESRSAPIVLLEQPRDLGNLGACVRVAAAADIAGVIVSGVHDPWDPAALRGSAGLHFALPVAHLGEDALGRLGRGRRGAAGGAADPDAEEAGDVAYAAADDASGVADAAADAAVNAIRPLIAIDPDGEELRPHLLPPRAILAFGSERQGLSEQLLGRADALVRLPMRPGVSSLNLATSVAALLYSWRLADVR